MDQPSLLTAVGPWEGVTIDFVRQRGRHSTAWKHRAPSERVRVNTITKYYANNPSVRQAQGPRKSNDYHTKNPSRKTAHFLCLLGQSSVVNQLCKETLVGVQAPHRTLQYGRVLAPEASRIQRSWRRVSVLRLRSAGLTIRLPQTQRCHQSTHCPTNSLPSPRIVPSPEFDL